MQNYQKYITRKKNDPTKQSKYFGHSLCIYFCENAHKSKIVSQRNETFSPEKKNGENPIERPKDRGSNIARRGWILPLYPFNGDAPSLPRHHPSLFQLSARFYILTPASSIPLHLLPRRNESSLSNSTAFSLRREGERIFPTVLTGSRPDIHPDHSVRIGNYALLHVRTTVLFGATPAAAANPRSHFASLHLSRPPARRPPPPRYAQRPRAPDVRNYIEFP